MNERHYSYQTTYSPPDYSGRFEIVYMPDGYRPSAGERIVWSSPVLPEDAEEGAPYPPTRLRVEYERLLREDGFVFPKDGDPSPLNLVEMCASPEEQSAQQPCAYGGLVEGHAVYCHNEGWLYSPRKCRRTWYTGGKVRDEDCEGFKTNPNYKPEVPS